MSHTEYRDVHIHTVSGSDKTRRVLVRVYDETDPCPEPMCEGGRVKFADGVYLDCSGCGGTGKRDLAWYGDTEIVEP